MLLPTTPQSIGRVLKSAVGSLLPYWVVLFNVAALLLVGCGEETAPRPDAPVESTAVTATDGELSAEERELLFKASGREWEEVGLEQMEAFLTPLPDSTSALFLWDPESGSDALKAFQEAVNGLQARGVRAAVAVLERGDYKNELIDLRASQIVVPAYRIPRFEKYDFIETGLPVNNSLIVAQAGGETAQAFSPNTPITGYRGLLQMMAPVRD